MLLAQQMMLGAAGSASEKLYVEDVFSTHIYTGNGGSQTINNGIDLVGKGGLVWVKNRQDSNTHGLCDTARGPNKALTSANTNVESGNTNEVTAYTATGFTIGNGNDFNTTGRNYVAWAFRKAAKFFDIVKYTGNGTDNRQIVHCLGVSPGMVIIKAVDYGGDDAIGQWHVWHRSLSVGGGAGTLFLNKAYSQTDVGANYFGNGVFDSTRLGVANAYTNQNGRQYIAYVFAHDTAVDGLIQCGSCAEPVGSNFTEVTLGWEPQYILFKLSTHSSAWYIVDAARGLGAYNVAPELFANSSEVENSGVNVQITATGFKVGAASGYSVNNYVYMAIRRPNKPPINGEQVYKPIVQTTQTRVEAGFAVDSVINQRRDSGAAIWSSRLTSAGMATYVGASEGSSGGTFASSAFDMTGFTGQLQSPGCPSVYHLFRRAPGFMDQVCYTGTGAAMTVAHNLSVTPELIFLKCRSHDRQWIVGGFSGSDDIVLNSSTGKVSRGMFQGRNETTFSVTADSDVNGSGYSYVAYLFASCPGVSKVGSYTGNGSNQIINCSFSNGSRFVLIKRTDATGDWYSWDTARGIVADNDPHLSLNNATAEVTSDDSIDPASPGFIVNQNSTTNINVNGASYIFLAIA